MTTGQVSGRAEVTIADGTVTGRIKDGVLTFLGIPYAAPPVGDLRWRPPERPSKFGRLEATRFAGPCAQVTGLGSYSGPPSTNEDCLYLNVFTITTGGPLKPVLVWLHGGGNVGGTSADYDASKLATGGPLGTPVVVVTLNYRLNLFGFLSADHLNAEGHASVNYGLLDQQAALAWVRDNIAAFGGDPDNVTLAGQSAGAINTGAHLISPGAADLFHRAIMQSMPAANLNFRSGDEALEQGNAFARAAGCSGSAGMRNLSAARVLQLQGTHNALGPYLTPTPIVDGTIVPMMPEEAWAAGSYHHMPILGGTVRNEGSFRLAAAEYFSGPPQAALTAAEYAARNSPVVLAEYPLAEHGDNPTLAQDRVISDAAFKCPSLRVLGLLAATNSGFGVYGYDFTYPRAPFYYPHMPNADDPSGFFQPLAAHSIDVQFLFPGFHGGNLGVNLDQSSGLPRELEGDELHMSDQLVGAWTRFAATGDPNGPGLAEWPAFTAPEGYLLRQDIPMSIVSASEYGREYHAAFWDARR